VAELDSAASADDSFRIGSRDATLKPRVAIGGDEDLIDGRDTSGVSSDRSRAISRNRGGYDSALRAVADDESCASQPAMRHSPGSVPAMSDPVQDPLSTREATLVESDGKNRGDGRSRGQSRTSPPAATSPWQTQFGNVTVLMTAVCGLAFMLLVVRSMAAHKFDTKGCRMSYMRPSYVKLVDFDSEYTRFASKYSLYLYRERGVDHVSKVCRDSLSQVEWPPSCG
jgi:hypothetical protein